MTGLSRRGVLLAGGTMLLAGCGVGGVPSIPGLPGQGDPRACRAPGELTSFSTVGGALLGYEITGMPTTMRSEAGFLGLLNSWAEDWADLSGMGAITEVWSYGAYVDRCGSYHQVGRAFDFARLVHERGTVSCRYDSWSPGTDTQLRGYWRLAASLHLHFAYTLTYLYNQAHHNHIHVDNSVSGDSFSTFREGSQVQVQMVQAACRYVFGRDVELTGDYDDQTRSALRPVQQGLGISRPLSDADGWREFLRAAASGA